MTDYLPAARGGLFPSSVDRATDKALERIEAGAVLARSADRAAISRAATTTEPRHAGGGLSR